MNVEYKNRYNDIYTFTKIDEGILFEGDFKWFRSGSSKDPDRDIIGMIDPSGGPYLSEDMDMGIISPKFKGLIIDQFKPVEKGYLILLK